jgi:hypothetical protein
MTYVGRIVGCSSGKQVIVQIRHTVWYLPTQPDAFLHPGWLCKDCAAREKPMVITDTPRGRLECVSLSAALNRHASNMICILDRPDRQNMRTFLPLSVAVFSIFFPMSCKRSPLTRFSSPFFHNPTSFQNSLVLSLYKCTFVLQSTNSGLYFSLVKDS